MVTDARHHGWSVRGCWGYRGLLSWLVCTWVLGLQMPTIMAGLYVGTRDPSLGVYVYTADTLLTEPSWAQLHFLK